MDKEGDPITHEYVLLYIYIYIHQYLYTSICGLNKVRIYINFPLHLNNLKLPIK